MRILMISPYPPFPPHAGGRTRMWEQILFLAKRHELTVVAFGFTEKDFLIPTELQEVCKQIIIVRRQKPTLAYTMQMSIPRLIYEYGTNEMRDTLQRFDASNFDVVLLEHIFVAQYASLFDKPTVLQEHNIESSVLKRFAQMQEESPEAFITNIRAFKAFHDATSQWKLMECYEDATWSKFPLRITVSQEDKQVMESRCSNGKVVVVSNGVNVEQKGLVPANPQRNILFMGTLEYYPNIDAVFYFVEQILPKLWDLNSRVKFFIAGLNPSLEIRQLEQDERITVVANPNDMREVAKDCRLTVVPLRFGGGTRLKILDSMSMGLPVVSTSLGCEGLQVKHGKDLLIADDPHEFAKSVSTLLESELLYNSYRHEGRLLVETIYDWQKLFPILEEALHCLVQAGGQAG